MNSSHRARLSLVAAAALFSTGGAAIKGCSFSGWQVAGLRSGIAALALVALVPAARRWPSRAELLVSIGYALTLVTFVVANKLTTAANAIFLQSTAPLYLLFLGPWLLREKIRRSDLWFLVVMGAGLAAFFLDDSRPVGSAPEPLLGNLIAVFSGIGWALTMTGLRWLGARDLAHGTTRGLGAVVTGNALAFFACTSVALALGQSYGAGSRADWLGVGYLGVFQIGLAYVLVTRSMGALPVFEASLLMLVEPVLSPFWAWIFQGEVPGILALVGAGLILAASIARVAWQARSSGAHSATR